MKKPYWLFILIILCSSVFATAEHYQFASTIQQTQFEHLLPKLRCLVCQNQSLAESNAPLAEDLRQQIANMIKQQHTDQQIIDYFVQRYGDFVLYQPPWLKTTYLLWLAPFCLMLIGFLVLFKTLRNRAQPLNLTSTEQEHLNQLFNSSKQEQ